MNFPKLSKKQDWEPPSVPSFLPTKIVLRDPPRVFPAIAYPLKQFKKKMEKNERSSADRLSGKGVSNNNQLTDLPGHLSGKTYGHSRLCTGLQLAGHIPFSMSCRTTHVRTVWPVPLPDNESNLSQGNLPHGA